jgi:hypothetical protein
MFESILCQVTESAPDVLESLIGLAVEIAREGREGRRVGTLFTPAVRGGTTQIAQARTRCAATKSGCAPHASRTSGAPDQQRGRRQVQQRAQRS